MSTIFLERLIFLDWASNSLVISTRFEEPCIHVGETRRDVRLFSTISAATG
jgi:hypothetical protein